MLKDSSVPTVTQQANTLLHYLTTKQRPPFEIWLWSTLQKIEFDYSTQSIEKLTRLFQELSKRGHQVDTLLSQEGGNAFILAIAVYIADYVARTTGERVAWLDFEQMQQVMAQQNQQHYTRLQLLPNFENSLTARIGNTYCRPLEIVLEVLDHHAELSSLITTTQQQVYEQSQVNLLEEPNQVATQYLAKVATGKLHDHTIGFYRYLATINFDYSNASLAAIDAALTQIQQDIQLKQQDYQSFMAQRENQAFCYLLGFYIGVTSSRLANVAMKWANYEQMRESLGDEFDNCIEHSFVLLMQDAYRTPILIVTNRLFAIAPNFPKTAIAFAEIIEQQNQSNLAIYLYEPNAAPNDLALPPLWRQAMQTAGKLLAQQLQYVASHQQVPVCMEAFNETPTPSEPSPLIVSAPSDELGATDMDAMIDTLYRQLHQNPKLDLGLIGSFDSQVNLAMGQTDGLVIEIRVYQVPALSLQLILPYRQADASKQQDIVIYPLISNQILDTVTTQQCSQMVTELYQACMTHCTTLLPNFWQDHYVGKLDFWAESPRQQYNKQADKRLVEGITLALLPKALVTVDDTQPLLSNAIIASVPAFDFASVSWRGYDLPKYILQTEPKQREYLQVLAPEQLIGDDLYSQAEATTDLYRRGKVVWGVVVQASPSLYQPLTESERDNPASTHELATAEVVFEVNGQASVSELQQKAQKLTDLLKLRTTDLPSDQAFYVLHLQDTRSRLLNYRYPQSLLADEVSRDYRLSSTWVWRRHLPNGMLSDSVVPLIIDSNNQGQVMILPSCFWDKAYYEYWLGKAYQYFGQDYDLLPYIEWQQRQGSLFENKAVGNRLFPKFKPTSAAAVQTSSRSNVGQVSVYSTNQVSHPPSNKGMSDNFNHNPDQALRGTTTVNQTLTSVATSTSPPATSTQSATALPTTMSNQTASNNQAITPELQQQLIKETARLQSQLSTKDKQKEQKLYLIAAIVVVLIMLAFIMGSLLK